MMADRTLTINYPSESNAPDKLSDLPASSSDLSLFQRKIEFHLARKTFTGFSNGGGNFRLETLNPNSSNPQRHDPKPTLNGKKVDGSEENGVDPELNFGITFRRIGAGLENLGNTCFLNSVLQCLTYTEPLAAYLQSGKHQTSCRTAGFCALCAIQKHVSRALQSTGRILAPKEIVLNLRCISRNFRNSRQEDAHEYMVNLLESMHKCCLPSGVPSESPSAYDKSLVHKIFGGRLRSQVKCMQCSFCSNKFDPFLDLSLEIVKAESLYKALTHFTAKEQLDGGERHYQCQQCKQKVKALKQLTIHKAPYVLTIHLKRFGSQLAGQKIDKKILFGPTLDLKPFVTDPHDGDLKYTLYGVLVHAGWSTHSGHYYCFVRTSSGMWYSLDDNRIDNNKQLHSCSHSLLVVFCLIFPSSLHSQTTVVSVMKSVSYGTVLRSESDMKISWTKLGEVGEGSLLPILVVQVSEKKVLDQKAYMLFYYRDKRNFASKKPLDVAQKEIMGTNAMGRNKPYLNFNHELKGTIESGRIEARVNDKMSAAAVAQRDSLNAGASLETLTNDVPNQILSSFKKAECSAPNKDTPLELSSRIPPVKDSVKGSYVTGLKDRECLPQQDSSVKGSNVPFKPDNAMITTSNAKLVECDPDRSSKKDAANIVAVPPSCNSILKSVTGKDLSDSGTISPNSNEFRNPEKDIDASIAISPNCCIPQRSLGVTSITKKAPSGEIGGEASSLDPSARKMEKVLPVMSSSPASRENSQGMADAKSAELSSLPITKPISAQKDVLTKPISVQKNVLKGKPNQRLKKKLSKCPIIKMHLTSKIIFGTSLSVRKKKHKRSKKCTSGTTTLSQKHLLGGDNLPLDLEPSTSDRYKTMPFVGPAHPQREGQKSGSKKKEKNLVENNVVSNSNGNFLMDVTDKEFRVRTGQNGAVLAVVDRSQMSSSIVSSAGSQLDDRGLDNSRDSRRDSMQNGLMSMLTRGLEETIVARWDEIESYPSHMTEPSGVQNVSIGYVADEWDEEYDRGKRKKVRSFKNDFSGPNPFQEIANMNSKIKKARIDHSSSGNKPYRI